MASCDPATMENGNKSCNKELANRIGLTNMASASSSLRKRSDIALLSKVKHPVLKQILANLQEVVLGTKLAIFFLSIPIAIAAKHFKFGRPCVFVLSLLGLTPLAERLSFLTEQIAFYTGATVGGLINATCGNATELIIALIALYQGKIEVVKCSLLGSILSNLLLVLGTSLLSGGLANLNEEQKYDRKQADVNSSLMLLALLCQMLPLMFKFADTKRSTGTTGAQILHLSRASSIIMLLCYVVYLFFQLKTHRHLFEAQQDDGESNEVSKDEQPMVIGFPSAVAWLVGMTVIIALLSDYIVDTIEAVSESWGLSVSFISIILLPIVGNACEHTSAVLFSLKNKLDITLGVALGSSTQIAMFVLPVNVVVGWIIGTNMDLSYNILETGSLFFAVLLTTFVLQDGTSHYLKGLVLVLCYFVIGSFFFLSSTPLHQTNAVIGVETSAKGVIEA
ncbi:hypothetical protein MRB53_000302 [Persea americana]|uniref:Uncharacterized protein n=1 Tax=Persea americana TaxID=3435 RepID=A0ACC2MPI0_PERAE|nr:hypothetical protein MRB53_000302 [Persea americana]